jgi:hypothetical protein
MNFGGIHGGPDGRRRLVAGEQRQRQQAGADDR